jgi:Protein of unknown function (DUF3071)
VVALRPVGVSEDGTSLILARRANAKGGFKLVIDDALVDQLDAARTRIMARAAHAKQKEAEAAAEAQEAAQPKDVRPSSKLTIKEIQVMLRQGKSVATVAKKAGVSPEWVERFQPPIIWERAGMADRARRSMFYRARMGESGSSLGESVEANLKSRRISLSPEQIAEGWDSVKRARGDRWVVTFRFTHRGRTRSADWEYDPESSKLRAINTLASELAWVPRRRRSARR